MDAQGLREAYVDFFKERGHAHIRPASLIPENDPTVLFTTAGMHPLVPYLLGERHPEGRRLVNFQKCIRTGDIDEVGDEGHLTFFEMLGNWSLGDYFKEESIRFSFDFLRDVLRIPLENLAVTAFEGIDGIPRDEETASYWRELGIPDDRIFFYGMEDNWWGPAGQTGPCGPDTEIFYDDGRPACGPDCGPACGCGRYTEIWNNVFMEYFKDKDGRFVPLEHRNVDTGMGLERVLRILEGEETVYGTELFRPIIAELEEISGRRCDDDARSFRIIADHLRAAVFLLGDGVVPSRMGQGYILRRLIRRASRYMSKLGYDGLFMHRIAEVVIRDYSSAYPELEANREAIVAGISAEEEGFHKTLSKGLRRFDEVVEGCAGGAIMDGESVFRLYDTFGFPVELTCELAAERGLSVDLDDFDRRFREHQERSRAGAGSFKGGLADHTEETTRLHTATHLLNAALTSVVDPGIRQRGSNITAERLRFDFNFDRKLTPEEIAAVEDFVNAAIEADLPVVCEEMEMEAAKEAGAIGVFDDKYDHVVKVYGIGDVSLELCGGPHVERTGEIGRFRITKESSSAAGVRRIRATVGRD